MNNFDEICDIKDPALIDTVSELRHYINVWNDDEQLCDFFHIDKETLSRICRYGKGDMDMEDAIRNIDNIVAECERKQLSIHEAKRKNLELQRMLERKQTTFCNNVGIRNIKLRLTRLANKGQNPIAKIFRLCLEAETVNIKAKVEGINFYPGPSFNHTVKEMLYHKKAEILNDLVGLCMEHNITFGVQESENHSANSVLYRDSHLKTPKSSV